ncbi:putative F-box/FBD/LRR-repeat protein At4g03220 [Andrographis paniculata]|uniref:putative F-box/FBD/LRR-repeat protein At4g03220 n=1 Tax=Andrographis paniculata TaxID=175694 RepID=UPI0021E972EF|nr:putative F-box/FBD/LRR-repeat protein At4g03220 [Andrographis paniculata]
MASDRISGLPNDVIDNILERLPLPDVVRTSVLSKEWRYKWSTIPHLNFDWDFMQFLPFPCPRECVISHILLLHEGSIVKFSLAHNLYHLHTGLDRWLQFLKSKSVEELSLSLNSVSCLYAIPNDLYSFHLLRHLVLVDVDINLPPSFQGFSALVELSLRNSWISSEGLHMFISKCPKLERLSLSDMHGITTFWCHDVEAPMIKYLKLGHLDCKLPPTFNGFSLLAKLELWVVQITEQELQRLVSECPLLESVSIEGCFEQIASCHLDINATNLKRLRLDCVDFTPTFEGFSRLIRLELTYVQITPEDLRSVISKCPMFECLSINQCFAPTTVWFLDIDAPNLRALYLNRTDIKILPTFSGFNRLDSLSLVELRIDTKELHMFLSKSPMLELLIIDKCNDQNTFWPLNIDAPNLRALYLVGFFSSICLRKTRSVEELSVKFPYYGLSSRGAQYGNFRYPGTIGDGSNLIKFLGQLPYLVKLEAGISFIQFLALGGVPQELPFKLNNLMTIELREMDFGILTVVACVVCLIRSSPILHNLDITFDQWKSMRWSPMRAEQMYKAVEYLKGEQKQNILCKNLKTVSILGFDGVESEVEFVKLLLLWGTKREQLEVNSHSLTKRLDTLEELKRFYWESSSKAIFFINNHRV